MGTYEFLTNTLTFLNKDNGIVGFSRSSGRDLFTGPVSSLFSNWDLASSIEPITGTGRLLQWNDPYPPVLTDSGVIAFQNQTVTATFAAVIPEPTTIIGSLLAGSFMLKIRKKRQK